MTDYAAQFRACLESLDIPTALRIYRRVYPHLPQPKNGREAAIIMHTARTAAGSMAINKRLYSHNWLVDEGYPSSLPDELRPAAEQIRPRVTKAVGFSVNTSMPEFKPAAEFIRDQVNGKIAEMFADGDTASRLVRSEMVEVKERAKKQIFGQFIRPDTMPLQVDLPARVRD